jgi:hypothetical protein
MPPFQRVKAVFLTNHQPALSYPLEELKSGLLYLDTNMRGHWEERSVDLGWMTAGGWTIQESGGQFLTREGRK